MKTYTKGGAENFSKAVETLYHEMNKKFGHEFALEFILAFYHGAGSDTPPR